MQRQLKVAIVGAAAGLIGTVVKSKSEPLLQSLFESRLPPTSAQKAEVGADPAGQPDNMPPAVIVEGAVKTLTGKEAPDTVVSAGSQAIHFSFGTGGAVVYSLLVDRLPIANLGGGSLAGLLLYGATHGSGFPVIGLQPPPTKMPDAAIGWEATSHVIYGMTVELVRRLGTLLIPE